jgi:hypothetical protein
MNIYYTAKDIEEMSAKGMKQIEIGPGVTLTDFARETAQQLNIALVDRGKEVKPATQQTPVPRSAARSSDRYNKPSGCMHSPNSIPAARPQAASSPNQTIEDTSSNTVTRLIDLMGKVIKRGE